MASHQYRFTATIQRGPYQQRIKGTLHNVLGIGNVMATARSLLIRKANLKHLGDLDGLTIRISRIKSKPLKK